MDYALSRFEGVTYDPTFDNQRLTKQIGRVYSCMADGQWHTLSEISQTTKDHEASVSAQIRNLRKPQFGSFVIERRPRGDRSMGLFEYRLSGQQTQISFDESGQGIWA